MGFLNKLFGISKNNDADASAVIVSAPPASTQTSVEPKLKKPRKPRVKKVVEETPTPQVEPEVRVLKFDFNPANPQIGSMELDWNAEFIEMLRQAGYRGVNPEALVDAWLNDVARNIINSSQPSTQQNPDGSNRYVSRRDLGDGLSEFS
jgi:hypothetical protein